MFKLSVKRWIIIVVTLVLVVVHLFVPKIKIDIIAICLVSFFLFLLLAPDMQKVLENIKSIKFKGFEIELHEMLKRAETVAEAAKNDLTPDQKTSLNYIPSIISDNNYGFLSSEPYSAILLIRAEIERKLRSLLANRGLIEENENISLNKMLNMAMSSQILSNNLQYAVREFNIVRNKIAHGRADELENETLLSALSLGEEIYKMISAVEAASAQQKGTNG